MTQGPDIPPGIPPEWRGILRRDERILWQGAPQNDQPNEKTGVISVAIGMALVVVFPIFLFRNLGDEQSVGGTVFIVLLGTAIIGKTAWGFFGRAMFAAYKIRHSFYTLTNRRAYTGWRLFGRRRLETWDITSHTRIELEPGYPGSVYFAEKVHQAKNSSWTEKIGFLNIRDAEKVYDLMLKVQEGKA